MAELFLDATGVKKAYGTRTVLDIAHFKLFDGDRIGLVGENGVGKSTFMGILAGEIQPDEGRVNRLRPVSWLKQLGGTDMDADDAHLGAEFRVKALRKGLSGGEHTRRRIASALSGAQGILLADEPTSDLDAEGIARLEKRLREYRGALVLVSHDRALLNGLCTQIAELSASRITLYPGNYDDYAQERQRRREFEQFEYDQYRGEQARLSGAIMGKKQHAASVVKLPKRMGNSEARLHKRSATETEEKLHKTRKALETRLEHLEEKQRPRDDPSIRMQLGAAHKIISQNALEVKGLTLRVGGEVLIKGASFVLPALSRTALLGPNGCGKTTLLRTVLSGAHGVRVAPTARIGLFDQDHENTLNMDASVIDNLMRDSVLSASDTRTVLARLGLRGDDVMKKVAVLSGGERAKVALSRLLVQDINLLILDEPTNHLDVYTMEALTSLLGDYGGTLLFVSHDRSFVRDIATRLVMFEGESLITHEGDMASYEAERSRDRQGEKAALERDALRMRMAVIAARLASPKKKDDVAELDAQYNELAKMLRAME